MPRQEIRRVPVWYFMERILSCREECPAGTLDSLILSTNGVCSRIMLDRVQMHCVGPSRMGKQSTAYKHRIVLFTSTNFKCLLQIMNSCRIDKRNAGPDEVANTIVVAPLLVSRKIVSDSDGFVEVEKAVTCSVEERQ